MRERGLKFWLIRHLLRNAIVAPVRERGLKFAGSSAKKYDAEVAPVRERGLKCSRPFCRTVPAASRSREGARIEICAHDNHEHENRVAPVRERGLKLNNVGLHVGFSLSLPRGSED